MLRQLIIDTQCQRFYGKRSSTDGKIWDDHIGTTVLPHCCKFNLQLTGKSMCKNTRIKSAAHISIDRTLEWRIELNT